MNQFFCLDLIWPPLAFITPSILLGMLLTKFPQTPLGILFIPYAFAPKAHGNQQEGPHLH
jgi:hypothetical protein